MKLNLGSGSARLPGFTNLDIDPAATPDILGDLRDLSMIKDGEVDEILASHSLEHIPTKDVPKTLKEWLRVLKPGGKVRIRVPNLWQIMENLRFWGDEPRADPLQLRNHIDVTYRIFGDFGDHKTAFTWVILKHYLEEAGFVKITRVYDDPTAQGHHPDALVVEAWKT